MTRKTALVVVDLQEDFLPSQGSLAVAEGRSIIPLINDLLDTQKYKWNAIFATQDWHPANHCSFASQHGVEPFSELAFEHPTGEKDEHGNIKTQKQVVWPDHCIQNSLGASIDPLFLGLFNQIDPNIPRFVVRKGYLQDREYYSCFKDSWKLHKTEIEDQLKNLSITDVVFVGIAYDYCVLNSAIDCLASGFNTYVLKDYTKSVSPENINKTDLSYTEGGVKIISVNDLKNLLE
ncbi:Isochorismatase hydrolase [Hyphopichia burtonii NRRL Y-1933]|uniref:nicotinamidase n=1 Tax=Hyphopichia burtonii NRRL Y-1933 TaxID=984485 RepID=A0A1E4RP24_9ASCO|nr:Isochorismatase hydrolase [Hyphopichia burtonii NRRL Y-1933]ODV69022.1 Isochorismatase hydrolase [Hyphopichia burtonii NRRL Y-1933]